MIDGGLIGTGGVFTPLHGCRKITWSLSAVVKIAPSMFFRPRMVAGDRAGISSACPSAFFLVTRSSFRCVTHSRTSDGRMAAIFMAPNHGMMCLPIWYE
jgi:hypothetical protein